MCCKCSVHKGFTSYFSTDLFFQPSAFSPLILPSSQRPSSVILDFLPGDLQFKGETDDEKISVEELRTQINHLMGLVDALKKEHG